MRINNHNAINRIGIFLIMILNIALLFSSCVSQRDMEYLRVKDTNDKVIQTFTDPVIPDYKLKSKDELHIQIKSLDDPSTNVFQQVSNQQGSYGSNVTPYSASLTSYMIDKAGNIQLPFIGNIFVEDKTIPEVISILTDSLNYILSNPTVTVKLVNRYVSVLGEVKNPGHFIFPQEKLTIYEALSIAGDITTYGDRNDVILARNENGKNIRINIDLTSAEIMSAEYYYIRPNDVLYVKPMQKRFWGLNEFPWSVLLTSISTGVLLYTVFGK